METTTFSHQAEDQSPLTNNSSLGRTSLEFSEPASTQTVDQRDQTRKATDGILFRFGGQIGQVAVESSQPDSESSSYEVFKHMDDVERRAALTNYDRANDLV